MRLISQTPGSDRTTLRKQVTRLLDDPDGIYAVYQPIVDVTHGMVVGYEALARFADSSISEVEGVFTTAKAMGVADRIEAAALAAAFEHRPTLPSHCFLTVNLSPPLLTSGIVRSILDRQGDLSGVVIELTEQTAIDSYSELEPHLNRYRSLGALIAVDDAGSGYAGLRHIVDLRPSIIKVDRHFVDGVDHDPVKRVMIEMLGTFADRTDCWLLVEGVERFEELDTVTALQVPLVQGYLTGRPAPPWADIAPEAQARLTGRSIAKAQLTIGELVQTCRVARSHDEARAWLRSEPELDFVALVNDNYRPMGFIDAESSLAGMTLDAMRVNIGTPLAQVAQRAITRKRKDRYTPVAVTDDTGVLLGIVPIERLIERLAALHL